MRETINNLSQQLTTHIIITCRSTLYRSSAGEMFVTNNILNFEALMRKSIFAFASHLSITENK